MLFGIKHDAIPRQTCRLWPQKSSHRRGKKHVLIQWFGSIFVKGLICESAMEERMYGVVLWADECDSKAVIWCEDHGNLAYYSAAEQNLHQGVALDAGDLIQFDLKEDRDVRRARNLQRVDVGYAPDIANSLKTMPKQESGTVVPFPGVLARQRSSSAC